MVTFCSHCGADLSSRPVGAAFGHWDARCPDCGLVAEERWSALAPGSEEVEYSLAEWTPGDRILLSSALAERDVLWRWEAGPLLVVDERDQPAVEEVLDDLEAEEAVASVSSNGAGEPEGDYGDGDALDATAQTAMADLFVVADRLQHTPDNGPLIAELERLEAMVAASPAPFGVEPRSWSEIAAMAGSIVAAGEAADEDAVASGARALRGFLRDFV